MIKVLNFYIREENMCILITYRKDKEITQRKGECRRIRECGSAHMKENKFDMLPDKERIKYEIAEELGLLDKVKKEGWKSLSAKESGKIGGIMTARLKKKGKE